MSYESTLWINTQIHIEFIIRGLGSNLLRCHTEKAAHKTQSHPNTQLVRLQSFVTLWHEKTRHPQYKHRLIIASRLAGPSSQIHRFQLIQPPAIRTNKHQLSISIANSQQIVYFGQHICSWKVVWLRFAPLAKVLSNEEWSAQGCDFGGASRSVFGWTSAWSYWRSRKWVSGCLYHLREIQLG